MWILNDKGEKIGWEFPENAKIDVFLSINEQEKIDTLQPYIFHPNGTKETNKEFLKVYGDDIEIMKNAFGNKQMKNRNAKKRKLNIKK